MRLNSKSYFPAALALAAATLFCAQISWSQQGSYATLDEVLERAFLDNAPQIQTLWLHKELKQEFKAALGFEPEGLRQKYWQQGDRTLWILEEIGKEYPITFAYVVDSGMIVSAQVMEYRESRGGEIRHSFFRKQFDDAQLEGNKLDRHIDGITGATLSVNAMTKMAKQALWLHAEALSQKQISVL